MIDFPCRLPWGECDTLAVRSLTGTTLKMRLGNPSSHKRVVIHAKQIEIVVTFYLSGGV